MVGRTKSKKKKPQSSAGVTGQGAGGHKGGRWPQGIQWQTTQMTSSPA